MVSISKHKHHNERLVRFFLEKAYPNKTPTIEDLIHDNVISGTQLSEIAISRATGIAIHEIGIGQDLDDGSDVKTSTVAYYDCKRKNATYSIPMAHIKTKNKNGLLRIVIFNPFFDSWFFFKIPGDVQKNSNQLWIRFNKSTGLPSGKFRNFLISSWGEFCQK